MIGPVRRLTDAERFDWLRLSRSDGVGPRTFLGLLSRFGDAASALRALPDLARRNRPAKAVTVCSERDAEREWAAARALGIRFLAACEPDYPAPLRATDAPPPVLAVTGVVETLGRPTVAVVGSRNASASGLVFTDRLVRALGVGGYVCVSGLARGIDAKAHVASLETGTIAVLAGGHDRIYPAEHALLVRRILERGAVVSEMPLGWEPRARDFPRRNRIVSGLSLGVVVVEASRRSGSLITARFANEQGREVFAVPGSPLDARAEGTNDLLRQGATICTSGEDVLAGLAPIRQTGVRPSVAEPAPGLLESEPLWDEDDPLAGADEGWSRAAEAPLRDAADARDPASRILALIGPVPMAIDDLIRASGLTPRDMQTALIELELSGRLSRHDGNRISAAAM